MFSSLTIQLVSHKVESHHSKPSPEGKHIEMPQGVAANIFMNFFQEYITGYAVNNRKTCLAEIAPERIYKFMQNGGMDTDAIEKIRNALQKIPNISDIEKMSAAELSASGKNDKDTDGENKVTYKNLCFQDDTTQPAALPIHKNSGSISWHGHGIRLDGHYASCTDKHLKSQKNVLLSPYIVKEGELSGHMFAACFDGHGLEYGRQVADSVAACFSKEKMNCVPKEDVREDGRLNDDFFDRLGNKLSTDNREEWKRGGSTMSLLHITPEGKLHTYTMGDSRIMLFQNGKSRFSTFDMSAHGFIEADDTVCKLQKTDLPGRGAKTESMGKSNGSNMAQRISANLESGTTKQKYFIKKYGELPPEQLQNIYPLYSAKKKVLQEKWSKMRVNEDEQSPGVEMSLTLYSAWGYGLAFDGVENRFIPVVQTFDLKKLNSGAPLQIVVGGSGVAGSFSVSQLEERIEKNNPVRSVNRLIRDSKLRNGSIPDGFIKSLASKSLTLMEFRMSE